MGYIDVETHPDPSSPRIHLSIQSLAFLSAAVTSAKMGFKHWAGPRDNLAFRLGLLARVDPVVLYLNL